jgi:hypothetical protein
MTKITSYLKLSLCFLIILICSCKSKLKTDNAIYYCMDHLTLDNTQMKLIQETGTKKLYAKFFDVFWNSVAKAPNAGAKMLIDKKTKEWLDSTGVEVIPVVFITNECLEKIYEGKYNALAERIYGLLNGQLTNYMMLPRIHEIQFNCDWTDSTRETYFSLINYMKMLPMILDRKISVSAAIYYDQCKDPKKFGVPPVDKVMLMCFSSPKQDISRNTVRTFKDDLADLNKYPLPMDIALPLPSERLVYRKNTFTGIIQNMENVNEQDSIITKISLDHYKINTDTVLNGTTVLQGDEIYAPPADIEKVLSYEMTLKPKLSSNKATISIFWTDSSNARKYAAPYLHMIFTGMQQ